MDSKKQKSAPLNFPVVDPNSPESVARGKVAEEIIERMARSKIEEHTRGEEYFRNNPRHHHSGSVTKSFDCCDYQSSNLQPKIFSDVDQTSMKAKTFAITDWVPERKLTLLIGPPGTGKTTLALALGAAISQGRNHQLWQGTTPNGYGYVSMSSTEDDFDDTIMPRFIACGGNVLRFKEFSGIPARHPSIANYTRPCNFSDTDNAIWLNEAKKLGNMGLIIFDPATQVIKGDVRSSSKARGGYENYGQFAEVLECAILGIGHTPKNTKGKGLYARIDGSGEAAKVARGIIMVAEIKGGPLANGAEYIMVLAKAFGKPVNYGVTYSIVGCDVVKDGITHESSRIVWHDLIPGKPEELLLLAESGEMVAGKVDPLGGAINFLKDALRKGPVHGGDVERLAKAAGHTTRALSAAKKTLGIISKKEEGSGQASRWFWLLPGSEPK